MDNGITYREENRYLIPNIALSYDTIPLGYYGMLRKDFCATCGSKMHHNRSVVKATGKRRNYYTCKLSKKGSAFCDEHRVRGDHVEELILETLKLVSTYVKDYKKEFTAEVQPDICHQTS